MQVGRGASTAGGPKRHHEVPWGDCDPEGLAKGEKGENGFIEEAGKTVREFVCAFISQIEDGIDDRLELDIDIIPWIVRWAAICYSRYAVGKDGRTAYERLRGSGSGAHHGGKKCGISSWEMGGIAEIRQKQTGFRESGWAQRREAPKR